MIALWVVLSLAGGGALGYLVAVARTDRLLAHMSDPELRRLGAKVRNRKVT
jgi:hypothetical protein